MYLPTLSIGYAIPDGNFSASVHSVFQSALNLRLDGQNELLTLVVLGEADLPQGIRLDTPKGFSFEEFQVGELAVCRDHILRFEKSSLAVQLSGGRRWECDLPTLKFDSAAPAVSAAWNYVWETLNGRQRLSQAEIIAEELVHESRQADLPRKAGEAIRALLYAARHYDLEKAFAVETLVGLGSGLTPSGDDMLVGYLAGLWCTIQDRSERIQFLTSLGEKVIELSSKTNDISRTYLYHAAQGQVSSRLADLAGAISRGEDRARLREIAETAMHVGHTSGMDAVTGLLIGLAVWMSPGTSFKGMTNV